MKLHLATPMQGRVAHVCTSLGDLRSIPVCRAQGFYPRDGAAKKKCPACITTIRKVLRSRPKR